jgi:hypothetical protein
MSGRPIEDTIEAISRDIDDGAVTVGDLVNRVSERSFGPLILIPAIILMSPLGAVPGLPAVVALLLMLIAIQMVVPGRQPWLPRSLRRISMDGQRLKKGMQTLRPYLSRLDPLVTRRFTILIEPPLIYAVGVGVIVLCLTIFPLAIIPFALLLPASCLLLIGIGLTAGDGVLVALGMIGAAAIPFGFQSFL